MTVHDSSADDTTEALFAQFGSLPGAPVALQAVLRRHRLVGDAWEALARALMREGGLDPKVRELVILVVAWHLQASYVWGGHALIARDVDLVVPTGDGPSWSPEQQSVIDATNQLLASGRLEADRAEALIRQIGEDEMVELVMVVGHYQAASMITNVLGLREPGCPDLPDAWPGSQL